MMSGGNYDPEDTLRFYALRLHEAGLIAPSPNKLIADTPIGASSTNSNAN
jgi:hypothetical protein